MTIPDKIDNNKEFQRFGDYQLKPLNYGINSAYVAIFQSVTLPYI